ELLSTLTLAGPEVENVRDLGAAGGEIVVGRLLTKEQRRNAGNLSLCDVQAGEGDALRGGCGARSREAGALVPLATVGARWPGRGTVWGGMSTRPGDVVPLALGGAQLPGGITIKKSKIRGEASQGMMCSGRELGFGEDHEGLLILPPAEEGGFYAEGQTFDAL